MDAPRSFFNTRRFCKIRRCAAPPPGQTFGWVAITQLNNLKDQPNQSHHRHETNSRRNRLRPKFNLNPFLTTFPNFTMNAINTDLPLPTERVSLNSDTTTPLHIIGELMNNSYARARKAFIERNAKDYQTLGRLQTDLGADFLTLNLDGTQRIQVKRKEMLDFLPELIPAIQEATSVPISFDNPSVEYHRVALKHYDSRKSGRPIVNSLAASREHLDEMIELVAH